LKIITPAFIPSPDVEKSVHHDMNIEDNIVNYKDIASLNTLIDPMRPGGIPIPRGKKKKG
jgi:hypothetical protein